MVNRAKMEEEMVDMSEEERHEFLADLGLPRAAWSRSSPGLPALGSSATSRTSEVRLDHHNGWTAPRPPGSSTPISAGFIRAEVIAYDATSSNGENGAKAVSARGRQDYVVRDGDVMHFRFNV